jgi:DNA-binding response OmpR family regulator
MLQDTEAGPPEIADTTGGRSRVLVAEDDDALRELVVGRLEDDGHEVFEARSGHEVLGLVRRIALDSFPTDDLDLVILDHRMPGLSGVEVLHELRARHSETPIILMTAFPDPWVDKLTQRLGAALLPKPFSLRALSESASTLLQGSGGRRRAR